MEKVQKSFLVEYSAIDMFNLVDDIKSYSNFLPWCSKSEILKREDDYLEAKLTIDYFKIKQTFATINHNKPGKEIHIKLLEGPFKYLEGYWGFEQISNVASRVSLNIEYEFSNSFFKKIMEYLFNYITMNLLDSFIKEADARYKK